MRLIATPDQIRAARGLLNLSQRQLALETGLHVQTVRAVETKADTKNSVSRDRIQQKLESMGVLFVPEDETAGVGDGVRFQLTTAKRDAVTGAPKAESDRAK